MRGSGREIGSGASNREDKARPAIRGWRAAARDGLATARAAGAAAYDRERTLPRLIAMDPRDLAVPAPGLDAAIRRRLERALRAERRRGEAGHWTYDLNRHLALTQALAAESGRTAKSGPNSEPKSGLKSAPKTRKRRPAGGSRTASR